MAINLKDIFDYVSPEPTYAQDLLDLGLIQSGALEKARRNAVTQGLLNFGLTYAAMPKNKGYGSALPYFAQAAVPAYAAMQKPYKDLKEDILVGAKLQDISFQRDERKNTEEAVSKFITDYPEYEGIKKLPLDKQAEFVTDFYKKKNTQKFTTAGYQNQYIVQDNKSGQRYNAVFSPQDGITYVNTPEGRVSYQDFIKDKDVSIFTAGNTQKGSLTSSAFKKLQDDITQDEIGLDNLVKYMKDSEDLPSGYAKLANQFTEWWKTFVNENDKYTEEELAQRVAEGRFQGLVGLVRVETVGGGVMTEFDAQRIMQRLGGDPKSISTNPVVIKEQIQDVLKNKYRRYSRNVNTYNINVESGTFSDYPKIELMTFSDDDLKAFDPNFLNEVPLQKSKVNIQTFASETEVQKAFDEGLVKKGDTVIVNGREFEIGE